MIFNSSNNYFISGIGMMCVIIIVTLSPYLHCTGSYKSGNTGILYKANEFKLKFYHNYMKL